MSHTPPIPAGCQRAAEHITARCVANPPYHFRDEDERNREVLWNAKLIAQETGVAELVAALIEALPHVEEGLDDPCEKPSGHAKTRGLAKRIRALLARHDQP